MPGITGIIRKNPCAIGTFAPIDIMLNSMTHDCTDTSGKYVNEALGLWAGWVNHGKSYSDCLPVWNEQKDIALLFTGEHFGDPEDVGRMRANGHRFDSDNASYLVHLYEELGNRFLENLNGWFSGVLVDLREGTVTLFNDRYGLGRIYFHENSEGIYFSSEAKSILSVFPGTRQLDATGFSEFCSCGCALNNRTIYSGISLLPGGSRWTSQRNGPVKRDLYFRKELWESQPVLNEQVYYEKLEETFSRILPRYFRDREQMGMSLTGGLDGRMIMAWARCQPKTLPCYTFGGSYRNCTDVTIAQKVAICSQQSHRVITIDDRFLDEFPSLAENSVYISDGSMDVSGAVELYANRIAKEIAPIRLTGNYGSEILRGSVAFKPRPLSPSLYDPDFVRLGEIAAQSYAHELQGNRTSFIAFKQVPWHHRSRLSVEQSQLTLRTPYLDNDLVSLAYQAPGNLATIGTEPSLRLIADGNAKLSRIPTDRGLLFKPTPFLTAARALYDEFTFKAEYAYDYGMPQWLAQIDHLFAPLHLERIFLGRHKFYHFRVWYRGALSSYVKEILLDPASQSRPYFRRGSLERIVNDHISGKRNYTLQIHQALTCELIQRQLIERLNNGLP